MKKAHTHTHTHTLTNTLYAGQDLYSTLIIIAVKRFFNVTLKRFIYLDIFVLVYIVSSS